MNEASTYTRISKMQEYLLMASLLILELPHQIVCPAGINLKVGLILVSLYDLLHCHESLCELECLFWLFKMGEWRMLKLFLMPFLLLLKLIQHFFLFRKECNISLQMRLLSSTKQHILWKIPVFLRLDKFGRDFLQYFLPIFIFLKFNTLLKWHPKD